ALLAHHAEGAGGAQAVLRHAPDAAKRSAALGAHREAAAQYERALRCAENLDKSALAALYEGLASEDALLGRWEQAEGERRGPGGGCGVSGATRRTSARPSACYPSRCGGCAGARSPTGPPRRPWRPWRRCRRARSWGGPTPTSPTAVWPWVPATRTCSGSS